MAFADTIYALSSGRLPSGIAVMRLSGPRAFAAGRALAGRLADPRVARLAKLRDPSSGEMLDHALVIAFPGPGSATGEDVLELHLHGGRAVVAAMLRCLSAQPGLRPAEAGEFTRRAHANGRMDLAEVEGLADLIAAETEAQRRQALALASGALSRRVAGWRASLIAALAYVEAGLDFSDEGDVAEDVGLEARAHIAPLLAEIGNVLADAERGERVRDGLTVALAGPPNAGKSTLLNRLAGREAAIVSPIPGTTRDVIEVHLDIGGQAVTLIDTAGLRDAADLVEAEGVRRALARAEGADLILWLAEDFTPPPPALARAVCFRTKADRADRQPLPSVWRSLSTVRAGGMDELLAVLEQALANFSDGEPALVTRERQRLALRAAAGHLQAALGAFGGHEELRAEELRLAARALDRLLGRVDVEDVLDALFSGFCIGK